MNMIKVKLNDFELFFENEDNFKKWQKTLKSSDRFEIVDSFEEIDIDLILQEEIEEKTKTYSEKPPCPLCSIGPDLEDDMCPVCESRLYS